MPRKPKLDASLLEAALEGLEQQRRELEGKISTVRSMLGVRTAPAGPAPAKRKRRLSRAARKRISEAQKRRWALAKGKAAK